MIIDELGVRELKDKIENPLKSIYDKLEAIGEFGQVSGEFELIFETLQELEQNWDRPNIQSAEPKSVLIDGKLYTPQVGA